MSSRFRDLFAISSIGMIVLASQASAADPSNHAEKVQAAIKKGSEYLIKLHQPAQGYKGGQNGIGTAALAGLALLESGVDAKNPSVDNITQFVRASCVQLTGTYEIALSLMFLDRLGDRADEPFIQYLGVRLLGGQNVHGGWTYKCGPELDAQVAANIRAALSNENKLVGGGGVGVRVPPKKIKPRDDLPDLPKPKSDAPAEEAPSPEVKESKLLHPEVRRILNIISDPRNVAPLPPGPIVPGFDDNSNTQFATLALWCARRHGVPVDKALQLLDKRFRSTQLKAGAWAYQLPAIDQNPSAPMTCAGLLGLAVGNVGRDAVLRSRPDKGKPIAAPAVANLADDEAVKAGWKSLGDYVTAQKSNGDTLYFLWSLERVAMIYGVDTVGTVDWYQWGSELIVRMQGGDGGCMSMFPGSNMENCTPLALLFLNRTNLAKDLTASITGKGEAMLKSGGASAKIDPKSSADPAAVKPSTNPKSPNPAANNKAEFDMRVNRLVEELLGSSNDKRAELIATLRDSKGAVYTEALARASDKAAGDIQIQAREALARRLTRMTATTLREMLVDEHREIRRAAAAACGLKADKQFVPDLIALLTDKEMLVPPAARSALVTLTSKDFGPEENATDADRTRAVLAWRAWWKSQR